MATKLYNKEGEFQYFKADKVQGALRSGWSPVAPTKEAIAATEEPDGFMGGSDLTEEQIREMAKERGISHYWNKNLDSLKQEMGL